MLYIVNNSGGLTSWEATRRCIQAHGIENTHVVFADTRIEDEDLYRFLDDQERYFGIKIERIVEGRTPFLVMHDERCITMQAAAPCSKILKRKAIDKYLAANYEPGTYTRVFGMDWTETHRIERLTASLAPQPVWFPLMEKPYVDKCQIAASLEKIGIKVPRLYAMGFTHNNCGGGCVKAGQAHYENLLRTMPERYAMWEAHEQEMQSHLGKPVTILKETRKGQVIPLSLKAIPERLEAQPSMFDQDDWGGCGCFVPVGETAERAV